MLAAAAWSMSWTEPATAQPAAMKINVAPGPLDSTLREFERQSGVELLYDRRLISDVESPGVAGSLTTETALFALLAGTDLVVRKSSTGVWVVERSTTSALEQQDANVAEILVVGRRTQNADIRRFEDDVQPYVVATREEIIRAHRDDVAQFISSRITSVTNVAEPGSPVPDFMSSFDLRGMGKLDSVVLVDGRRMPSIPESGIGFRQADINAILLHSIDRIEVLTGTAGGIHGFGALGGVINIVLDRDVDGLEVHTTQGISSRGDARRKGLEGRYGWKSADGTTEMMWSGSFREMDALKVKDRGFAVRDRRRTFELAPDVYSLVFPHGRGLEVRSWFRIDPDTGEIVAAPDLTFKPEYGGQELGSNLTWLPLGFSGDADALVSALREHSGEIDFGIDGNEARTDLGPKSQSSAVLANVTHRMESGWELYADAVLLRNWGENTGKTGTSQAAPFNGMVFMAPESPANPFTDYITVGYPILAFDIGERKRVESGRYTAGLEARLPWGWRGTAEASWGRLRYTSSVTDAIPLGSSYFLFGDEADLETNPLGDWNTFEGVISDGIGLFNTLELESRFRAQSLRLAGPIFDVDGGATTLTVLAERRSERVPAGWITTGTITSPDSMSSEQRSDPQSSVTHSYYGELRSRPFGDDARLPLIRGLELQLAIRRDIQQVEYPRNPVFPESVPIDRRFDGDAYTIGAKVSPLRWLTLRGSYATGDQPPPSASLADRFDLSFDADFIVGQDPKRGGSDIGAEGEGIVRLSGNPDLDMARATSLSVGAVFMPIGDDGPRLSIDYSRIRRTGEPYLYTISEVLAHEDHWPARVTRAPLTDADRASGFAGGRIEFIDVAHSNDGALTTDVFDLRAQWPLSLWGGRLRLYADATYFKSNIRSATFTPDVSLEGYFDGPLERRANGGFDWSRNDLTVGANLQYFGSHRVVGRDPLLTDESTLLQLQGSSRIPAQAYLDLYASWRITSQRFGPLESLTFDAGIVNVLDKSPPREHYLINWGPGISRHGDPRLRRFELGVSCHF
jgi:outer membrane receptor protein involved in Fe transport